VPFYADSVRRLILLDFLGRPGVTEKAFQKRHDTLRKLVKATGAKDGDALVLDLLAHETVQRLLENRRYHWNWNPDVDLDFGPEDAE
jgi:hypothetical protein